MSLYISNEHHHHRFFLDHVTKLVHVNPIRHGGGGHIVPAADFFVCYGSIRDLKKALDKVIKAYGEKG